MPPLLCNLVLICPRFTRKLQNLYAKEYKNVPFLFTMKRKGHVFNLLPGKVYSHSIVEGGFEEMS